MFEQETSPRKPSKSAEKMPFCNRLHLKFILGVKYNIFVNKILKY